MGCNFTTATLVNQETFQAKLENLDLEAIAQRLMHHEHGLRWSYEQAISAVARYKMFLYLIYFYSNRTIIPTREIDFVWHYHILDTRKYACDCEYLFGYFLHHSPCSYGSEVEEVALERAFAETLVLFTKHFGITYSEEILNPGCAFVINLKDKLHQRSGCPDPRKA